MLQKQSQNKVQISTLPAGTKQSPDFISNATIDHE